MGDNIMGNFERSRIFFVVLHGILDFFAVVLLSWTYGDMKSTLTDFLSIMWTLYISISATSLFLMIAQVSLLSIGLVLSLANAVLPIVHIFISDEVDDFSHDFFVKVYVFRFLTRVITNGQALFQTGVT